jgi:hypothetical protein
MSVQGLFAVYPLSFYYIINATKKEPVSDRFFFGARDRNRTGTALRAAGF